EHVLWILDRVDAGLVSRIALLPRESGELLQAQVENLVGLLFAERITAFSQPRRTTNNDPDLLDLSFRELECEKFHSGLVAICRFANDADEFVEIPQRNQITFQRFSALFGFAQFKTRTAQDYFAAMLDVAGVCFLERK